MLTAALLRYGYAVVFVAAAFEGDATLLTATFLAHRGYLQLHIVIILAAVATVTINQVYFWLGRLYGQRWLATMKKSHYHDKLFRWVTRHGIVLVLLSRFVYGFRIAIPVSCGATGMSPLLFATTDVAGSVVWSGLVGMAGYAIGQFLEVLLDDIRPYEGRLALAMLVVALGLLAWRGRDWWTVRTLKDPTAAEVNEDR